MRPHGGKVPALRRLRHKDLAPSGDFRFPIPAESWKREIPHRAQIKIGTGGGFGDSEFGAWRTLFEAARLVPGSGRSNLQGPRHAE